ncbi:MAG: hypothetical protein PVG45_12475 [Gammaproteobacteria bacterium]|jgi:hypothetical protein
MADHEKELDELLEKLKQGRDELNVKIHLGKAEAVDLWQETEDKWRHLRRELDRINHDTDDVARDVGAAAMLLAEEIRHGYERLKKLL